MDGRVLKFPSTSPSDLGVTVYDPSRGVPVAELKVQQLLDFALTSRLYLTKNPITAVKVVKEGKLRHG